MATEIKLPRLGQGMESGTIVKWLKSEGDAVEKGEALYELDTDKVTQEVEAEASGVLLKIAVREGEVEVGKTIGFIGDQGEAVSEPAETASEPERERDRRSSANGSKREAEAEPAEPAPTEHADLGARSKATPPTRHLPRQRGGAPAQLRVADP